MTAVRHLECLKYANFNLPHCLRPQSVCSCKMNGYGDVASLQFPIWRPSAILNFGNKQILTFCTVYSHNVHVHAKFRRDRLHKYSEFSISNMAAVRHLEFFKYANFNLLRCLRHQSACSCKISSWSDKRLQIFSEYSFFNMAAVRHIEFRK